MFRHITAIMRRMYIGSSKSIHTTTLIPTTVHLLQWWTTTVTLLQRFFYCSEHLRKSVFDISWICCVLFCFMASTSSNLLHFRQIFISGNEKKVTRWKVGRIRRLLHVWDGFRVFPRVVAQLETSAMVRRRGGFANTLTVTFLVACCILRGWEATELLNNVSYLLCDPLERLIIHKSNHFVLHRTWPRIPQNFARF